MSTARTTTSPGGQAVKDEAHVGLWTNREFRFLAGGQTFGSIGGAISMFVFPLLAAQLHGSVLQAALVSTAMPLGAVATSMLGGTVADRYDKRVVLLWTASGTVVVYASLALAAAVHSLTIVHMAVAALLIGIRGSFFGPAEQAAARRLVTTEQLPAMQAAFQSRASLASLVAGPAGGALLAAGSWIPFAVGAGSYLVVLALVSRVRADLSGTGSVRSGAPSDGGALAGLRWTRRNPDVLSIMVSCSALNFGFAALLFMIVVTLTLSGVPTLHIGFLETGAAAGGLLGAMLAAKLVRRLRTGPTVAVILGLVCLCAVAMAVSSQLWQFIVLIGICELVLPTANSGLIGFMMARCPEGLQGRVSAALQMLATGVTPLAPLGAGIALNGLGFLPAALLVVAIAVIAFVAVSSNATLRRIPRPAQWSSFIGELAR